MKHLLPMLLAIAALTACAAQPFAIERVNARLYRSPQPVTSSDWRAVAAALGPGGQIVKLNAEDEGSDAPAADYGLVVHDLAIEPRGDGPIYAQAEGVFTKPDPARLTEAVALSCDPHLVVLVHCTHGWDRTGLDIAEERVLCEGWTLDAAHDEWHREAHYVPHGPRIPAPGLEAAWHDFSERMLAVDRAAADVAASLGVMGAAGISLP